MTDYILKKIKMLFIWKVKSEHWWAELAKTVFANKTGYLHLLQIYTVWNSNIGFDKDKAMNNYMNNYILIEHIVYCYMLQCFSKLKGPQRPYNVQLTKTPNRIYIYIYIYCISIILYIFIIFISFILLTVLLQLIGCVNMGKLISSSLCFAIKTIFISFLI